MRSKPRTQQEKDWHSLVAEFARESDWLVNMYGAVTHNPTQFQLDHVVGSQTKRKVNGVSVKVGEWAVMPIPIEIHDITSNHPLNKTLRPANYRNAFGNEKQVWIKFINAMKNEGYELPFGDDVIYAIMR